METKDISYYRPLAYAAGIGSMLGSGIIVGLAATISVWQSGLGLTNGQVGIISGALTFAIAFGSLFGGRIAESIGLIKVFNWINLFYAIGAGIAVFAPNYITLLIGVVITGIASGTDLPISLTVVSRDSPDAKTSAKLVSSTQICQANSKNSMTKEQLVTKKIARTVKKLRLNQLLRFCLAKTKSSCTSSLQF